MTNTDTPHPVRVNKYLALQLGISRREADELIEHGRVMLGDKPAKLGDRILPGDLILVDGDPVKGTAKTRYFMLHKPTGYVSSRRPQGESPTIYALLPKELHALKPVGRLDRNSSGLLLLTNDGDFAFRMTHPKFIKTKVYQVQLDRPLEPLHQQMIGDFGIQLDDGTSQFTVTRLGDDPSNPDRHKSGSDTYEITMHEGRNRQIRRTFAALGYTVTQLHRTQFGSYSLNDMPAGQYEPVRPI